MLVAYCVDEQITADSSLFIFVKLYIIEKIKTLSRVKSEWCDELHNRIIQLIKRVETFNDLVDLLRTPIRCCYGSLKVYFVPLMKLYHYVCMLNLEGLSELSNDDVHDFLCVETSGLCDATLRNYRFVMVNFFTFLHATAIDGRNKKLPISNIYPQSFQPNIASINSPKEYLCHIDRLKLFHAIFTTNFNKHYCDRNRLLLLTMFLTGMKPSEIIHLRMSDIRIKGRLYAISIGSDLNQNGRTNYVAKHFIHHHYTSVCQSYRGNNYDFLFRNKNGKQLKEHNVQKIIERVIRESNIRTQSKGSMVFRKLYANHVYHKTKDVVLLQELLGYRNIQSVQNLIIDLDRAKEIADSAC